MNFVMFYLFHFLSFLYFVYNNPRWWKDIIRKIVNSIKMKLKKKYHVKVIIIHTPTSNGVNVVVSKKKNTKTWKDLFISLKHQKVSKKRRKKTVLNKWLFSLRNYIISYNFFFFFFHSFSFFLFYCFFLMRHLVVTFRPYPVKRFQHLVELQNLVEYHNVGWTKKRTDEQKKKWNEKKLFFLFLYLMAFNFKWWMGIFFYYFIFCFWKFKLRLS